MNRSIIYSASGVTMVSYSEGSPRPGSRRRARAPSYRERVAAAQILQSTWRAYRARLGFAAAVISNARQRQDTAAAAAESGRRARAAGAAAEAARARRRQEQVDEAADRAAASEARRINSSASTIQRAYRSYVQCCRAAESATAAAHAAATTIQSRYREHRSLIERMARSHLQETAALTLQRAWRHRQEHFLAEAAFVADSLVQRLPEAALRAKASAYGIWAAALEGSPATANPIFY